MPEYSSTTITPADGVQVPSMNGSTAGNFTLGALKSYMLSSKGQANGLAGLDANGKLDPSQIPDSLDDVLVYATRTNFPQTGADGKIYITADNNKMYRWDSDASDYVELSVDLSAYATKAEVNALSARVSNLEQTTKQDEQTVSYPNDLTYSSIMPNGVPASVADYGEVATIRGKSRGWNQLAKALNSTNWSFSSATGSFSDGVATFTASAYRGNVGMSSGEKTLPNVAGKNVLISVLVKTTTATSDIQLYAYGGYCVKSGIATTGWQRITAIVTTSASWGYDLTGNNRATVEDARSGSWDAVQVKDWVIRDLSSIAPEFTPSGNVDNDLASLVQQIPDLLTYDSYNAGSLVDTVVSGVEAIGFNRWDEDFQSGYYWNTGNGAKTSSENWNCSRNKQDCTGGTDYYVYVKNKSAFLIHVLWFDANDNYIAYEGRLSAGIVTSPVNACKFAINIAVEEYGGTTYNHDICVNISNSSLNGQYFPYEKHTIMLSSPFTGKSAGDVAEVLDVETGKKTRPIGSVDLGTLSWGYDTSQDYPFFYTLSLADVLTESLEDVNDHLILAGGGYVIPNISVTAGDNVFSNCENMSIARHWKDYIYLKNTSKTGSDLVDGHASWLEGVMLNYVLATPLSDEQVCNPIIDNYIEVQAGGTINTIQSQSPVIDNCLDVNFDFIPA